MRSPSPCSGFTMIEVLVALLVVGASALAMVMLQLHALRNSRDNALQATATAMALELAELRAAYRDGAPVAGADDPYLFAFDAAQLPVASANANADCSSPCDARSFARAAVAEWSGRFARKLPGARVAVCHDSGDSRGWPCDDDPAAPVVAKLGWRNTSADAAPAMTLLIGR